MRTISTFKNIEEATEHIKLILAELDDNFTYETILSLTETECSQEGCDWEELGDIVLDCLRDMDALEGFMVYEDEEGAPCWDFVESERDEELTTLPDELYVDNGEGVAVIHDKDATKSGMYPIIVVKASFWDRIGKKVWAVLDRAGRDVTSRVSPTFYIELFKE